LIVVPPKASPARRWLAHLVRAAAGAIRAGDPFDDDLVFESEAVLRLARRHRVAPLLHLAQCDGRIGDPLPLAFADACRGIYYATLRKNVVALDAGEEVLAALGAHGIAAAPLKGWALLTGAARARGGTSAVYPDPATRPMDDLDLMVAADERGLAGAVLETLGFVPIQSSRVRSSLYAAGHEIAFHKRVGDINLFVELHWASAGPESLLRGMIFSGERFLRTLCVRNEESGRLEPTWLGNLLFAAVHGARHAYDRWIWLYDLHQLLATSPLDWESVVRAARAWRVRGPLYAGLVSTRELFRTPVPKEVIAALAPGPVRRGLLHRSLSASMRDEASRRPGRVAKLLLGESWWDVARTAAWATLPGAAWYAARGEEPRFRNRLAQPARAWLQAGERP
jgi:putative nucleotidyltransferase-like protein